ncbi:MAG TPA: sigma-70 family RNA polymerase sigma factor [Devosiaceae bacterium]
MTPHAEGISDLIARTALGDRVAFRQLYERTSAKLFGVCLRILKERQDAEEALQDVYIKIWQRSGHYLEGQASPISWLVAIARNHSLDRLRARRPAALDIESALDLAATDPDPEQSAENGEQRQKIDECLDRLAPDRADAVRSAYLDGWSYAELAERHGVPLNTMRTWLRRSLIRLRDCLSP